jgi:hypothetical protein
MKTSNKVLLSAFGIVLILVTALIISLTMHAHRTVSFALASSTSFANSDNAPMREYHVAADSKINAINLQLESRVDLQIINTAAQKKIVIAGNNNLLPYIHVSQQNGYLTIFADHEYEFLHNNSSNIKITIYTNTADLNALQVSGAASIVLPDINSNNFELKVNGASSAELSGTANTFTAEVNGSSKINAKNLKANNANIKLMGASAIDVYATQNIDAKIFGAGLINYYGKPKNVTQSIMGAGAVKNMDSL